MSKKSLITLTIRYLAAIALTCAFAKAAWAEEQFAASVTTNGVTTFHSTLASAWNDACAAQRARVDVTVKLLKDASLDVNLSTGSNGALTLDLNDHVLAYTGQSSSIVTHNGGVLHVVDTATTRTSRYFICGENGLWTLADKETELAVKGGILTGGRNSAIFFAYNSGDVYSISNVSFVGNSSTYNGGAVSVASTAIALAMTDCAFFGNVASKNGGAVAAGICTMTDCRVEGNVATERGGGVYVRDHGGLVRTRVVGNRAGTGGGVHLTLDAGGCFPAGVKMLMADGSEKMVEELVKGDVVATFDHVGGTNSSAAVFYVYRGIGAQEVFTLSFASGATLDIADRHDLLIETTRKYVTVSSDNARSFVGSRFYNFATGGWDELVAVTPAKDCEAHYSIYTRGHGNCVANGMLTVPDDKDCFFNIYELDDNLKADAERLAADIETYGLATPADYPNVPPDDFADGNVRHAFIAIGKGLTTQEEILFWNEFDYGPITVQKAASAPMMALGEFTSIAAPSAPYLKVGEGTVVTGNVTSAGAVSNCHLDLGNNAVVDILDGATGLDIGVTLSKHVGIFGWTNAVNHAASFFADDPTYSVSYTADGVLALRAGVQVGGDAWATITNGTCTIYGTGDMWSYDEPGTSALWAHRGLFSSVVIGDGVTSVGTNAFAYMKGVRDVEIGGAVANVSSNAFYFCVGITNLVVGAGVRVVGDNAFERCNSLTTLRFGSMELAKACQGRTFKITARITLDGGEPVVDCVPEIVVDSYDRILKGKKELSDSQWETIGDVRAIPKEYHFFKYVYEEK